jgi:hypothetical protein
MLLGQFTLLPEQFSAGSQGPVEALHIEPAFNMTSGGQVALLPVQVSAVSQPPADARQVNPADTNVQEEEQHEFVAAPFCEPRSHASELALIPSPHTPLQ